MKNKNDKTWFPYDMRFQDEQWSGEFGDNYTKRNFQYVNEMDKSYITRYGISRRKLNAMFLEDTIGVDSKILEIGCNVGTQLIILRELGYKYLYGIDINEYALKAGRGRDPSLNLIVGNILNIPFKDKYFDMVMTNGLLIHISPDDYSKVISEICRVTKEYIYGLEYYSKDVKEIEYRGKTGMLWKADFPSLFQKYHYEILKIEKQMILDYKDNGGNQDVIYLIKKLGGGD